MYWNTYSTLCTALHTLLYVLQYIHHSMYCTTYNTLCNAMHTILYVLYCVRSLLLQPKVASLLYLRRPAVRPAGRGHFVTLSVPKNETPFFRSWGWNFACGTHLRSNFDWRCQKSDRHKPSRENQISKIGVSGTDHFDHFWPKKTLL